MNKILVIQTIILVNNNVLIIGITHVYISSKSLSYHLGSDKSRIKSFIPRCVAKATTHSIVSPQV